MSRKRSAGVDVIFILGLVFAGIGAIFTVLGTVFYIKLDSLIDSPNVQGDARVLPAIFLPLGLCFLVVGILFILLHLRKNREILRLVSEGNYVMATIAEVSFNYSVTVNGRHPVRLECHYQDPTSGKMRVFMSKNIFGNLQELVGTEIPVFVDRNDYSKYYVDVESLLA